MATTCSTDQKDLAGWKPTLLLIWGLPATAFMAGIFVAPTLRMAIWSISLLWMGVACLVNTSRCGRVHCAFTGPFFLLLALASLLHGSGIVPLGQHGWRWIAITLLVGGIILNYLPERVWGRYFERPPRARQ
jgi:hypothetical protein